MPQNLKSHHYIFHSKIGGSVLGAIVLPLVGFGVGGIAAGSTAAAWQSSIGSAGIVASGSLFAILQSLGTTGLGIILFGRLFHRFSLICYYLNREIMLLK